MLCCHGGWEWILFANNESYSPEYKIAFIDFEPGAYSHPVHDVVAIKSPFEGYLVFVESVQDMRVSFPLSYILCFFGSACVILPNSYWMWTEHWA